MNELAQAPAHDVGTIPPVQHHEPLSPYRMTILALHVQHKSLCVTTLMRHLEALSGTRHSPSQTNTAVVQLTRQGYLSKPFRKSKPKGKKGNKPKYRTSTPLGRDVLRQTIEHLRKQLDLAVEALETRGL